MCKNRVIIGYVWSVEVSRKSKQNKNKGAFWACSWASGGVGPSKRKRNKKSPFGYVIGFVAHWVLGAHLGCLDYRVGVQKY